MVFTVCCEPYLQSEYGVDYVSESPVKLLDRLLHGQRRVPDEQARPARALAGLPARVGRTRPRSERSPGALHMTCHALCGMSGFALLGLGGGVSRVPGPGPPLLLHRNLRVRIRKKLETFS